MWSRSFLKRLSNKDVLEAEVSVYSSALKASGTWVQRRAPVHWEDHRQEEISEKEFDLVQLRSGSYKLHSGSYKLRSGSYKLRSIFDLWPKKKIYVKIEIPDMIPEKTFIGYRPFKE